MKGFAVLSALFLVLSSFGFAWASPFIACDSYVSPAVIPDYFKVSLDGGSEAQSPVWSGTLGDGSARTNGLHFDVGAVAVGNHIVQVKACKAATIYDPEACSAVSPFSWSRGAPPVAPGTPTGTTLTR